jgi:hypothetical protein
MSSEPRSGVWETAVLNEDGSIEVEHVVVFEDDNQAHGTEIVQPGTAKYEEVIARHPNLKVGEPHEIELPRTHQGPANIDPKNVIEIRTD